MHPQISDAALCGQDRSHVVSLDATFIHPETKDAFAKMKVAAFNSGHLLAIASGFRDFATQLKIWNQKVTGQRPVLDATGRAVDISKLSEKELLFAILRWSALPGASRHHWGTDIDVFDSGALKEGTKLLLSPEEIAPGGVMEKFNEWLSANANRFGFFRPYEVDLGGVSPEWWHLSFAPISIPFAASLSVDLVREKLNAADIQLKRVILENLEEIFARYVRNISTPAQ